MNMASSTALPNEQAMQAYHRQEKRARIAGVAGRSASRALRRDWADLIAERVLADNIAGYLRFRAVCKSWRRCIASQHAHGGPDRRFHASPEVDHAPADLRVPPAAPRLPQRLDRAAHPGGHTEDPLPLVNLPNATKWSRHRCSLEYLRVSGAGLAGGSTVALHLGPCSLFIAKPGDDRWTPLPVDHCNTIIRQPLLLRHREGRHGGGHHRRLAAPQLVMVAGLSNWDFKRYDPTVKLVDKDGELILVHPPRCERDNNNAFRGFQGGYEGAPGFHIAPPMQGLGGGHALFIGMRKLGQRGGLPLLVHAGPFAYLSADTVYSFMDDGSKYDPPRIQAYHLPYGDGRIQGRIDGARPFRVIQDYVSRYVCGRKIVRVKRRRPQLHAPRLPDYEHRCSNIGSQKFRKTESQ
ncbi:hypothetical protein D1007_48018 [Hordeum vulgare]|nr:hypothetical protein D1007_48018 [Hordeum vulgare]